MQISKLSLGCYGVDLTHVPSFVFLLDVIDVKNPGAVFVVGDGNSGVSSNHMGVHSQNGGLLKMHPRDLKQKVLDTEKSKCPKA